MDKLLLRNTALRHYEMIADSNHLKDLSPNHLGRAQRRKVYWAIRRHAFGLWVSRCQS